MRRIVSRNEAERNHRRGVNAPRLLCCVGVLGAWHSMSNENVDSPVVRPGAPGRGNFGRGRILLAESCVI